MGLEIERKENLLLIYGEGEGGLLIIDISDSCGHKEQFKKTVLSEELFFFGYNFKGCDVNVSAALFEDCDLERKPIVWEYEEFFCEAPRLTFL